MVVITSRLQGPAVDSEQTTISLFTMVYRRSPIRMRPPVWPAQHLWPMVGCPMRAVYQPVRNRSLNLARTRFPAFPVWQNGPSSVWQRYSGVVHKTGRREQIILVEASHQQTPKILRQNEHCYCSGSLPGHTRWTSRWSITSGRDSADGMGYQPMPSGSSIQQLRTPWTDLFVPKSTRKWMPCQYRGRGSGPCMPPPFKMISAVLAKIHQSPGLAAIRFLLDDRVLDARTTSIISGISNMASDSPYENSSQYFVRISQ